MCLSGCSEGKADVAVAELSKQVSVGEPVERKVTPAQTQPVKAVDTVPAIPPTPPPVYKGPVIDFVYPEPAHDPITPPSYGKSPCRVPTAPTTPVKPQEPQQLMLQLLDGSNWRAMVREVSICHPAEIMLMQESPSSLSFEADPDAAPVQLFLHFYTLKDKSDTACNGTHANCTTMTRRLPLRYTSTEPVLTASFVADPASDYYVIELRVDVACDNPGCVSIAQLPVCFDVFAQGTDGTCAVSSVIAAKPWQDDWYQCKTKFAFSPNPPKKEMVSFKCLPILHK